MSEYLFSYGTLQKEDVQLKLFGRLLKGTRDVLTGYRLSGVEIRDKLFLAEGGDRYQQTLIPAEDEGESVGGTVFEISPEELILADRYEPESYERIRVALRSGREAWVYVARPS